MMQPTAEPNAAPVTVVMVDVLMMNLLLSFFGFFRKQLLNTLDVSPTCVTLLVVKEASKGDGDEGFGGSENREIPHSAHG